MKMIQLSVAIASGLVAAINAAPNGSTALAEGRDAILQEFADLGLNAFGEPNDDEAAGADEAVRDVPFPDGTPRSPDPAPGDPEPSAPPPDAPDEPAPPTGTVTE